MRREYTIREVAELGDWQVQLARDISNETDIAITEIYRKLRGNTFIIEFDATLSKETVDDIVSKHLPTSTGYDK